MLYTETPTQDVINILRYTNDLTHELGLTEVQVDLVALKKVCFGMRNKFPHEAGENEASVFKKMGNFLTHFLAYKPIRSAFPPEIVKGLRSFDPNAFVGFEIAVACIEKSTINFKEAENKEIGNPIYLSDHSYADVICALSTDENISPQNHYHIYSVFLEQLTYKTNPDCQYTAENPSNDGACSSSYYDGREIVYDPTKGDDLSGL